MGGLLWRTKEVVFKISQGHVAFSVRNVPFWYEGIGLMFTSAAKAEPLLFSYSIPHRMAIFSYCIPFEFLAVWIDQDNLVIESKIVRRNTSSVVPRKKFVKLLEIPCTEKYQKIIDFFSSHKNKKIICNLSSV